VLSRVKAYNVNALMDFSCTVLEEYYCHRFRNFVNNRNFNARKYMLPLNRKSLYLNIDNIISNSDDFLVPSEDKTCMYIVNVKVGVYSCPFEKYGKFCKHQYAVSVNSCPFEKYGKFCKHQYAVSKCFDVIS